MKIRALAGFGLRWLGDRLCNKETWSSAVQGEAAVYYQILDARTAEETFEANPRGTHIVLAGQLGTPRTEPWFCPFRLGTRDESLPVFLAKERALPSDQTEATGGFQIGVVPGSDIPVMGSLEGMREHHTAILGMTGTGKTELALDIVRQAVEAGTKGRFAWTSRESTA